MKSTNTLKTIFIIMNNPNKISLSGDNSKRLKLLQFRSKSHITPNLKLTQ